MFTSLHILMISAIVLFIQQHKSATNLQFRVISHSTTGDRVTIDSQSGDVRMTLEGDTGQLVIICYQALQTLGQGTDRSDLIL